MPCYHLLTLYRSKSGPGKDGKWPLTGLGFGDVMQPVQVPCGRCIGCRLERSRQWAIRCVHEAQVHQDNCFITLTYSDDNLTWGLNRPTLYPRDLTLFFKKLRKKYGSGIRFFACGEYGGTTGRPHYHACVFGLDFADKKLYSKRDGISLFSSDDLDKIWGHGATKIGDVNFETAAYVARYIVTKKLGETAHYYDDESILPEFVRMSRRPGIGKLWLNKFMSDVFPGDKVILRGGIKCTPPRYYSGQFEIQDPIKYEEIKNKRKINLEKTYENNTPKRLKVREIIKLAQIKNLLRSL